MIPYEVVIPFYKGRGTVGLVVDGLNQQSHRPQRIWIVNDACPEGVPEQVTAHPLVKVIDKPNEGPDHARVYGLSQVETPHVALIDQDDVPCWWHFERLTAALLAFPEAQAAFAPKGWPPGTEPNVPSQFGVPNSFDPWPDFPFVTVSPSSWLFRRSALKESGGWPTSYRGVSDFYLTNLLSLHSPVVRAPDASWTYMLSPGSDSARLRTAELASYFEGLEIAARDLAGLRAVAVPQDTEMLRRRLKLIGELLRIVQLGGKSDFEKGEIESVAMALDASLAEEPDSVQKNAIGTLFWFLQPQLKHPETHTRWAQLLLVEWPEQAPVSKALLTQFWSVQLRNTDIAKLILHYPSKHRIWRFSLYTLAQRASSRLRTKAPSF